MKQLWKKLLHTFLVCLSHLGIVTLQIEQELCLIKSTIVSVEKNLKGAWGPIQNLALPS
ncbi:hypothetical protein M758_UG128900 [Ceratodon purpureus]|nr:hypothetical protein M758_UG128900 [Ceratodon purpureus]